MKYFGALLLTLLVFTIMVGGTYNQQEIINVSLKLEPTADAQDVLVENAMCDYAGILTVKLDRDNNTLDVSYDKARLSLDDLCYIVSTLGFRTQPLEHTKASM
ncbi:MAG: hypothetical protein KAU50_04565 [Candidatus Marinimicrobia bacterium]|nr:hypothetical protein [Candidatus Neomarinimicrobiota bacterium]